MNPECTDAAYGTDVPIVPSASSLDPIANRRSEDEVPGLGHSWMPLPPAQQPIWPRVWPGL